MQIIGHRGARNEAPENTLGGFQHLKDLGIIAVEFDLRQLQDQTLVVIHDDDLERTTGIQYPIIKCDVTQLAQHNHCKLWPHWSQHEPTPVLEQVLNIIKYFSHIELEIKAVASMMDAQNLVQTLHQKLSKDWQDTLVITSFDEKVLQALQHENSPFKRGLLVEDQPESAIHTALKLGCCQIGWLNTLTTRQRVQDTHQAGLKVSVWTVNEPERALELQHWGVDGLITDVPSLMQKHL